MKLDALVDWYGRLSPADLAGIGEIYHEEARFRDPFNDVRGHTAIEGVFRHMFATTDEPVFRIGDVHRDAVTAWVSWQFDFGLRGRAMHVDGVTRLDFGADGRVIDHRDYWDASELYQQLPLLGGLMTYLRKKLRAAPVQKP